MLSAQNILALLTARGGSKGVPRKNIREVGGKPLITWTIEAALKSAHDLRVLVSTDDVEIAAVSKASGAEVPFLRPDHLAVDTASSEAVVFHALDWLERQANYRPDLILLLQPTSPLRTSQDIDDALQLQMENDAEAVVSVTMNERPIQWLRKVDDEGILAHVVTTGHIARRQEAEQLYQLNGAIYLIKPDVLVREKTFYPPRTHAYIMPPERSLDIDTDFDLLLADFLLTDRQRKEEEHA